MIHSHDNCCDATPILDRLKAGDHLDKYESINLAKSLSSANKSLDKSSEDLLESCIETGKLFLSEELGDIFFPQYINLALSVYLKLDCIEKVAICVVQIIGLDNSFKQDDNNKDKEEEFCLDKYNLNSENSEIGFQNDSNQGNEYIQNNNYYSRDSSDCSELETSLVNVSTMSWSSPTRDDCEDTMGDVFNTSTRIKETHQQNNYEFNAIATEIKKWFPQWLSKHNSNSNIIDIDIDNDCEDIGVIDEAIEISQLTNDNRGSHNHSESIFDDKGDDSIATAKLSFSMSLNIDSNAMFDDVIQSIKQTHNSVQIMKVPVPSATSVTYSITGPISDLQCIQIKLNEVFAKEEDVRFSSLGIVREYPALISAPSNDDADFQHNTIMFSVRLLKIHPSILKSSEIYLDADRSITIVRDNEIAVAYLTSGKPAIKFRSKTLCVKAIVNPDMNLIAITDNKVITILGLDVPTNFIETDHLLNANCTCNILYWKWISPTTLAFITNASVFHWNTASQTGPIRIFDCHIKFSSNSHCIRNYFVSANLHWCLICGDSSITCNNSTVAVGEAGGALQLFSVMENTSHLLNGHTGNFIEVRLPGRSELATIFCFDRIQDIAVQVAPTSSPVLHIMELGCIQHYEPFRVLQPNYISSTWLLTDYPILLSISKTYDMIFILTKLGNFYIFDVFAGSHVYSTQLTNDVLLFASCTNDADENEIVVLFENGLTKLFRINQSNFIKHLFSPYFQNVTLAMRTVRKITFSNVAALTNEFNKRVDSGDINNAVEIAIHSPNACLRNTLTIDKLLTVTAPRCGIAEPVLVYLNALLIVHDKLNSFESEVMVQCLLNRNDLVKLGKLINEGKFEFSVALGDMILGTNRYLALKVYHLSTTGGTSKIVNCFISSREYHKAIEYMTRIDCTCDYIELIRCVLKIDTQRAVEFGIALVAHTHNHTNNTAYKLRIFEMFNNENCKVQANEFLLTVLKSNNPMDRHLQTKLLEVNIINGMSYFVDDILHRRILTHFDRPFITRLYCRYRMFNTALDLDLGHVPVSQSSLMMMANQGGDYRINIPYLPYLQSNQVINNGLTQSDIDLLNWSDWQQSESSSSISISSHLTEHVLNTVSSSVGTHTSPLPLSTAIPKLPTPSSEPPKDFICPISFDIMSDPVITIYGHTFERSAILEWLQHKSYCPVTHQTLYHNNLFPNIALRSMIEIWNKENLGGNA